MPIALELHRVMPRYANTRDSANRNRVPINAMVKEGLIGFSPDVLPAFVPQFRKTFWRLTPQKIANEARITSEINKVETCCDSIPWI